MSEQKRPDRPELWKEIDKIFDTYDANSPISRGRVIRAILALIPNTEQIDAMLVEARRTARREGYAEGFLTKARNQVELAKKQERERIEALAFKDTNYGIWGQKMLLSDGWQALKSS